MNPICVALDTRDNKRLKELADATQEWVGCFKIGLTAFAALGPDVVTGLVPRRPVFLDLKFNDIPAQVEGAVSAVARLGARYTTVHSSGGRAMMEAAVGAAGDDLTVLAVTVLTSLDDTDLTALGWNPPVSDAVVRLAEVALEAGAGGLVCSPLEVGRLRARFGTVADGGPVLVVPGVRPAGRAGDDQRRVLGPRETLAAGADLLVVGRPITAAADPGAATKAILEGLTA